MEYPLEAAPTAESEDWGETKKVIRCQGCGAETILGENDSATFCAFCGNPHVLENQEKAGVKPETVIPFAVSQETAVASFRKWLKGKLFAPGKAKKMASLGQIAGVYLPHWTYDDKASASYVGQEGHWYYVEVPTTVTRDGKQVTEMRRERRTRWEPTAGQVGHAYNDVVIPGSERLQGSLLESVQPYDLKELCTYQAAFLAGYQAEKPVVDVKAGWVKAKDRIESDLRSRAYQDILLRADEAKVETLDARHQDVKWKLTLLPMYLSSFTFKDKIYQVLVNGQTGKCNGQSPVSWVRVLAAILLLAALCVGAYYLMERL